MGKLAQQGAFSVKESSHSSNVDVIIWMCDLDPAWTDEAMQAYCSWLQQKLQVLKQQLGLQSLRHCRADVDFSRNGLSDAAVGTLLDTLAQSEMHVTILKLFANCIGPVGMQHLCNFLRRASFPIHEVHLSHNEIDDMSALK